MTKLEDPVNPWDSVLPMCPSLTSQRCESQSFPYHHQSLLS